MLKILTHYTVGRLFSRATNFANRAIKGVRGNYFHKTILAVLFTIHVNLRAMEFPLIFGEINFMEVPKIYEIREIYGQRVPYGIYSIMLLMYSLPGMILLYLAMPFFTLKMFLDEIATFLAVVNV